MGVSVLGTAGYMLLEGWTLIEAAYMTAITLTTVGFLEVSPLSPEARVFTILLLASGVTVFFYLIGAFGEFVVSGRRGSSSPPATTRPTSSSPSPPGPSTRSW